MCGIAGFFDFSKNTSSTVLHKMTDALTHRGPNDSGYELIDNPNALIGLGQRRLSIIDLSSNGKQPMEFDNLTIIFNGEIYNYQEIRDELIMEGYSFNSTSDTEVILKGFHRWGDDVVNRFIGMFVYVIYDSERNEITICRDRAGVKPLYYYKNDSVFLFASELKSLHQHPSFYKEIDVNSLSLFLQYSYVPAPHTIFKNTYKLKPAHYLKLSLQTQKFTETRYWDVCAIIITNQLLIFLMKMQLMKLKDY